MCTVTWRRTDAGYRVFFNRDERRGRPAAEPPSIRTRGARRLLVPRDPVSGGTWLGTSDLGLTVGLLNHYPPDARQPAEPLTRGLLAGRLLLESGAAAAVEALGTCDLARLPPFLLFAIDLSGGPFLCAWDGRRLARGEAEPPVTTSSFRPAAVAAARRAAYPGRAGGPAPGDAGLLAYHRGHVPSATAYSVCMHRDDARTVSFSDLAVGGGTATFCYTAGPPCRPRAPVAHRGLALAVSGP